MEMARSAPAAVIFELFRPVSTQTDAGPVRTEEWKAVPASGRQRERREREAAGDQKGADRQSSNLAFVSSRVLSRSQTSSPFLLPGSRPSARHSSPLWRGATRTSPSRSWPAGDTSDSATTTTLSSATPMLLQPLPGRRWPRSWWRAFLWKRRRRMRTRAIADVLRRRRR
jgi:hypothetical protein